MHKVAEHVYEKVLSSDTGSVAVSPGVEDQDNGSFAEEKVELLCNEQVGNKLINSKAVCIRVKKIFYLKYCQFLVIRSYPSSHLTTEL